MIVEYEVTPIGQHQGRLTMRMYDGTHPGGYTDYTLAEGKLGNMLTVRDFLRDAYRLGRSQGQVEQLDEMLGELKTAVAQI